MSIEIIGLFLKGYIDKQTFEKSLYETIDDLIDVLNGSVIDELLNCNYSSNEQVSHLFFVLDEYLATNYTDAYLYINDAYVERVINSDRNDWIAEYLRKHHQKTTCVIIDCTNTMTAEELVKSFKDSMPFPTWCGNSWDAINDLIGEVVPEELHLRGWDAVKKRLPNDAEKVSHILEQIDDSVCMVCYD